MEQSQNDPCSFDEQEDESAASPGRELVPTPRHDGFTPKRRRKFLKALRKSGCVARACRVAQISDTAAYKARQRDPEFAALWKAALSRRGGDIETEAWKLAVEGVEEEIWAYGKLVGTRRRRDPQLFRMLLQASNPKRYRGQGGKAAAKPDRPKGEFEQRAAEASEEEVNEARERIIRRIARLREQRISEGTHYWGEDGTMIPTGYVKATDAAAGPAQAEPHPSQAEPDRTDPQPSQTARDEAAESEKSRISADPPRPQPRIIGF